jgi:hypothetical protein
VDRSWFYGGHSAMKPIILIARLKAATKGSVELDQAIAETFGVPIACYTTSFSAAYSLFPASVVNFNLFSFGGQRNEKDLRDAYWGCRVHDCAQLVGSERAKRNVKSLILPMRLGKEPRIMLEKAIAERFCEFSITHVATPFLTICGVAIKVRIGQTMDDELDTNHG